MIFRATDHRQAERLPCRQKRAGKGTVFSAGKTTCRKGGHDGNAQSGKISNATCFFILKMILLVWILTLL